MIDWFTWVQVAVATATGLFCFGLAATRRGPNDYALGGLALVELLLIAQAIMALVAPAVGNFLQGNVLEFWVYLVSAILLPPAAALWALVDRTRWSSAILAVAAFAIAVMVYRMHQIWFVADFAAAIGARV